MSLRTRVLLTIGLTAISLVVVLSPIFSRTLLQAFVEAELRDTERDAGHARAFLTDELRAIDLINRDWASWDDTYAFIEDANPAYIQSNITDETFRNTHLNLMLFVHASGRVVFARAYDLEAGEEVAVPQGVYDALPVLARPTEEGQRGLLLLPEGVLLVTARPILTSEERGPARGALIFGRYLSPDLLDRMSQHLDLAVTAYRADRPEEWPEDLQAVSPQLSPQTPIRARALDRARIAGYGLMTDLYGRPALILRTEGPREIYARGLLALRYLMGTTTALGLLVISAILLLLERNILARLASLAAQVRAVGAEGKPRGRVALRGRDELADLARAFNETLDALARRDEELTRLNAILRAIRNINQAIAQEKDRERLLQTACDELVRTRGYAGAWAVLTGPDGRPEASNAAGVSAEDFAALLEAWKAGQLPRCARQALAMPEPLIVTEPEAHLNCPLCLAHQGATAIAIRMAYSERIYGVLCVTLPPDVAPSPEEQRLLTEVAGDLAFALHSLEQEAALRESEERFRLLAENSLTGIYLIQDGLLRYVNPAGAHMFGYEPEELIGRMSPLDVVAPEDREQVTENIRRRLAGEALSVRYTVQGLRKDGSRFPCEVLGTRVDYRGRPAILGTIVDLTDRVRAEEAVRRRAEQTEALRQIALELFSQTDLNLLLPSIVRRAVDLVDGSAGGLYLYRPEEDVLEWVVSVGPDQPPIGTRLRPAEGGVSRRVWETGHPFWVDDYRNWEERAAICADSPWKAVIGVPVRRGEEMLGVLIVCTDPPRTFSQEDADLLEVFAAQAAVALTNARLYETIRQEREQLDFLHRLGQRLAGTLDVAAIAQEALETLCGMTGAQQGVVYTLEPGTPRLHLVAAVGHEGASAEELDQRLQLQVGQGLAGWVALHRRSAVVDDVLWDDRWLVVRGMDEHVRSAVSVPLLFGEELVGVMSLGSTETATFTADHVRLLEAAGAVIAGALLNARLYQAERERARRMAAVAEVSERLAATLNPEAVYRELVEGVVRAFGYDYAGLMLLDEAAGELEFVAGAGIWAGLTPRGYRQKITEGMIGWVARHGETLLANDVSREPLYIAPYLTETRAELDVPLKYHGRLIGVLTIQSARLYAFTPLDVATLETLADNAAAALANARLYEQERRARERVEALYRIGQIVNSTLDPDVILDLLTKEAVEVTGATHGSVLVPDPERGVFERRSLRGYSPEERERALTQPLSLTEGINSRAYRTRTAYYVPNVQQDPDYFPLIPTTRSELVIPLLWGDRVLGNLDLQSPQVDAFRDVDMDFLRALADQVAIALENARLYEEERHRAQEQEILALIATALNTLEVRRAFPILVHGLRTLTGCDRVAVALLDESRTHYRITVLETPHPVLGIGTVLPLSTTPVWEDILEGRPHFCPDMSAEANYAAIRALYLAGFRSYVSLPLRVGGRIIGALHVVSQREHNFRWAQVRFLRQVADALAAAIENERLYRAEREQRELAEALAEAASILARTLDPEQIMAQILEQVARVVPGDAFNVMMVENGTARIVRWRGYESFGAESRVAALALPVTETPNLWKMIRTGEPMLIPDTHADPEWIKIEGLEWVRSYVAAPIVIRGITVGFMNVDGTRPDQFGPADAARLKAFADQVAIALENAQLYQELRRYASTLEEQVRERTAQLAAQYARLETILRSTGDGIVLTDSQGEILQANPVAQRWLSEALPPEASRHLRDTIRDLAQRASERPERVLELPGLDLEVRAVPLEDPTGEGAAVVALHDVTQYKTLERMRARFISSISHELRTPVSTIKLYAEMIERRPERWREFLDVIRREAEWQAQLVEEVLEISRLDAGRVELRLKPVPLNSLAEHTIATFQVMAQEKGISLVFHPSPEEPVALADEIRLTQVLKNLVVNAINYTPAGGRVEVRTGKGELEGRLWATLEVSDTGIGIAPEELPHLFDRFFRSERVRELRIPGTGLGLSIAKEIVDRHGGRITVQSEVGIGTTFTVWLPLSEL